MPMHRPSASTLVALERLGIDESPVPAEPPAPHTVPLACGSITVLIGPSGCGKSRALANLLLRGGERFHVVSARDIPASDLWPLDWIETLGDHSLGVELARDLGLFDARLLRTPVRALSAGQRARLALLAALLRCKDGDGLIVDEFGAELDETGLRALAVVLRKLVNRLSLRCAIATHREDTLSDLAPDIVVRFDGQKAFTQRGYERRPSLLQSLRIRKATKADWKRFAPYHHRGVNLAPVSGVWVAALDGRDIGIAVYAYAGANNRGRRLILPPALWAGSMFERTRAINSRLRVLQRIVVLPEFRGIGVAAELVRCTLPMTTTPFIECIASDAGFLERAGMALVGTIEPDRRARALLSFLASHGRKARDLAYEQTRSRFRESLAAEECARFDRLLLSAFRVHIETRHGALRGHVDRHGMTEAAFDKLPIFFRRLELAPNYYIWRKPGAAL